MESNHRGFEPTRLGTPCPRAGPIDNTMRLGFDKKFGLPGIVSEHAAMLAVIAKNSNEALSGFWKNAQSTAKVMLFHHLALTNPDRLHAWLGTTPVEWWKGSPQKAKSADEAKPAKGVASIQGKYDTISGGMLHILFLNSPTTFLDLLTRQTHLFQTSGVRYYMAIWCESLTPQQREPFQELLLSQPVSWYSTTPGRILLLNTINSPKHLELALAAALASPDYTIHPMLETMAPGITGCITIANAMLQDTKQKKAYVRNWMQGQDKPATPTEPLDLPEI